MAHTVRAVVVEHLTLELVELHCLTAYLLQEVEEEEVVTARVVDMEMAEMVVD